MTQRNSPCVAAVILDYNRRSARRDHRRAAVQHVRLVALDVDFDERGAREAVPPAPAGVQSLDVHRRGAVPRVGRVREGKRSEVSFERVVRV